MHRNCRPGAVRFIWQPFDLYVNYCWSSFGRAVKGLQWMDIHHAAHHSHVTRTLAVDTHKIATENTNSSEVRGREHYKRREQLSTHKSTEKSTTVKMSLLICSCESRQMPFSFFLSSFLVLALSIVGSHNMNYQIQISPYILYVYFTICEMKY